MTDCQSLKTESVKKAKKEAEKAEKVAERQKRRQKGGKGGGKGRRKAENAWRRERKSEFEDGSDGATEMEKEGERKREMEGMEGARYQKKNFFWWSAGSKSNDKSSKVICSQVQPGAWPGAVCQFEGLKQKQSFYTNFEDA